MGFLSHVPVVVQTAFLLVLSNCFMTFAWYGHLRFLSDKAWYVAAVVSWSIALFEYLLQVLANRIGYGELSLAQLKILQEVITLTVFIPFFALFHEGKLQVGLCVGRALHGGGGVLYVPVARRLMTRTPCEKPKRKAFGQKSPSVTPASAGRQGNV